jgi:hypothetical protein
MEKGLWWHQQQKHIIEYSEATAVASSSINDLAIVPYTCSSIGLLHRLRAENSQQSSNARSRIRCTNDPIELVKTGNLEGLKQAVNVSALSGSSSCHDRTLPDKSDFWSLELTIWTTAKMIFLHFLNGLLTQ